MPGTVGRAMGRIRREVAQLGPAKALLVTHMRAPERAQALTTMLAQDLELPAEQVLMAELGPALASHGGSGAVASGIVRLG